MRMRIIWGAKVPKSGVMRMRYKGDSGDMRMRMTLSGYGISKQNNVQSLLSASSIWLIMGFMKCHHLSTFKVLKVE